MHAAPVGVSKQLWKKKKKILPVIQLFCQSLFCKKRAYRSSFTPAVKNSGEILKLILPDFPRRAELVLACFGLLWIFCELVLIVIDHFGSLWMVYM